MKLSNQGVRAFGSQGSVAQRLAMPERFGASEEGTFVQPEGTIRQGAVRPDVC